MFTFEEPIEDSPGNGEVCMFMMRFRFSLVYVACAITIFPIGATLRASAQTPSTGVSFEVATIKPVDPSFHFDGTRYWAHINAAGASYWYMTLVNLVCYAYGVQSFQVTAPDWASTVKFDADARFPKGADQKDERKMLPVSPGGPLQTNLPHREQTAG